MSDRDPAPPSARTDARRSPWRRFTIADGIVLIVALAGGLALGFRGEDNWWLSPSWQRIAYGVSALGFGGALACPMLLGFQVGFRGRRTLGPGDLAWSVASAPLILALILTPLSSLLALLAYLGAILIGHLALIAGAIAVLFFLAYRKSRKYLSWTDFLGLGFCLAIAGLNWFIRDAFGHI